MHDIHAPNRALLQRLMNMCDEEYSNLVWNKAELWINHNLCNDEIGKSILLQEPYFWKWWQQQWNRRNRILIYDLHLSSLPDDVDVIDFVRHEFQNAHSIEALNIFPNRFIMANTYANMLALATTEKLIKA